MSCVISSCAGPVWASSSPLPRFKPCPPGASDLPSFTSVELSRKLADSEGFISPTFFNRSETSRLSPLPKTTFCAALVVAKNAPSRNSSASPLPKTISMSKSSTCTDFTSACETVKAKTDWPFWLWVSTTLTERTPEGKFDDGAAESAAAEVALPAGASVTDGVEFADVAMMFASLCQPDVPNDGSLSPWSRARCCAAVQSA